MSKSKSRSGSRTPSVSLPPERNELRASRIPRGSRTPALGTRLPRGSRAPSEPAWTKRARLMIRALEDAVGATSPDSATVASIERAWAAWEMGGTTGTAVRRVAHLIDRAYVAMHENSSKQPEEALQGCARILYGGLPRAVRDQTDFAKVVGLVRRLEQEPELWPAVVKTTAELLGWHKDALNYAGHVIRIAMATESEPLA